MNRRTQCDRLLAVFAANPNGLTDDSAAAKAGLQLPGVCWWKRCSDLRNDGRIGWATDMFGNKVKVMGPNGVLVGVSVFYNSEMGK